MDLYILGLSIALSVPIVLGLTRRLGGHKKRVIMDEDEAVGIALGHYPDSHVLNVQRGDDGRAAMVATHEGVVLMTVVGHHIACRRLTQGEIKRVKDQRGALEITLGDPGFPNVSIAVMQDERRTEWLAQLTLINEVS